MTQQQKLLKVASELGITDLKNMQGTTRVLYHAQDSVTGPGAAMPNVTFFGDTLTNATPIAQTNVPAGSKLQVNEALLVEKIQFHVVTTGGGNLVEPQSNWGDREVIVNFYVGNKRVIKDVRTSLNPFFFDGSAYQYLKNMAIWLEGDGIVIPPQVEFYVEAKFITQFGNANTTGFAGEQVMCSLYGTGVLLNLNTTL